MHCLGKVILFFLIFELTKSNPIFPETAKSGNLSKIYGGEFVYQPVPYQVSIQTKGNHHCAGSILSDIWIVTSAHCVVDDKTDTTLPTEEFQVLAGHFNACTSKAKRNDVKEIISHPYYRGPGDSYDIALLKLKRPLLLKEGSSVNKISFGNFKLPDFSQVTFTGWGRIDESTYPCQLSKIEMLTLTHETCSKKLAESFIGEDTLCAVRSTTKGICYGDSGGPLVVEFQKKFYLVGVASFVLDDCGYNNPDIFTDVSLHVDWINNYLYS